MTNYRKYNSNINNKNKKYLLNQKKHYILLKKAE